MVGQADATPLPDIMKPSLVTIVVLLALAPAVPAVATILRVPVDQPDLPTALAAAAAGDTVRVAATHTVTGGLTVPDRGLTVSGGWDSTFTSRDQRTLVTAGQGAPSLTIVGQGTRVLGFAIAAGDGALRDEPVVGRYGGGVLVLGNDHHLSDLAISGAQLGGGGQFAAGGGLALIETNSTVEQCTITGCQATWGGGGFIQGGAPTVRRLTADQNRCGPDAGGQMAQGAGLMVSAADATLEDCDLVGGRQAVRGGGLAWLGIRGRTLTLDRCRFTDNTMVQDGGGLYGEDGVVVLQDCVFTANQPAPGAPYASGGGAYITRARVTVTACRFERNMAAAGGGLTVNQGPAVTVAGCVFWDNDAGQFGAALNYQTNQDGAITGNTLAANSNPADAGVLNLVNAAVPLQNNLVAFNTGAGVSVSGTAAGLACNDVVGNSGGGWSGVADPTGQDGNLSQDPLFCDLAAGDLGLDAGSPCLSAPGCGLIGALDQGCGGDVSAPPPSALGTVTAFPNPANPAVTIRYELAAAGPVRLTIHDARGRLVRRLVDGPRPAGRHDVRWDGVDADGRAAPSGIYLFRLEGIAAPATGRLTLLR